MVLPWVLGVWVLTDPESPSQGQAGAGTWGDAAFLQAPAAPLPWPWCRSSLSAASLGIAAGVEGAIAAAWAPCEPAATWDWGRAHSLAPGMGDQRVAGVKSRCCNLPPRQGTCGCARETPLAWGAAGLLHQALLMLCHLGLAFASRLGAYLHLGCW